MKTATFLRAAALAVFVATTTLTPAAMASPTDTTTSPTPHIALIGEEARDGKFAFVVTSVQSSVGGGKSQPQGIYEVVSMSVTNIGDRSQGYYGGNQKLIDTQGRQFSSDRMANIHLNGDLEGTDINPGNQIAVKVAFDVPRNASPEWLVLHDSMYSNGVRVNIYPGSQ